MCGIVGMAGNINRKEHKVFRDMLLFDVVRGQDSTGIFRVPINPNQSNQIIKDIGPPQDLWSYYAEHTKEFDHRGVLTGASKVLIGHNRAATIGAITVENAHPFNFDHITGVHNGSLINTYGLEDDGMDVDSQAVFNTIALKGIEHTWENLYGAAALVWWNEEEKTINMIRNSQRPLYIGYNEKRDMLLWASERWMINIAMSRNGCGMAKTKANVVQSPVSLEENVLYSFNVTTTGVDLAERRELKKHKTPVYQAGYNVVRGSGGAHKATSALKEQRSKKQRLNNGWAADLDRAGKEVRGCLIELTSLYKVYDSTSKIWEYKIAGKKCDDDARVEIITTTIESFEKWQKLRDSSVGAKVFVKAVARPRFKTNEKTGLITYFIASDRIILHKVSHVKRAQPEVDQIPAASKEEAEVKEFYGPFHSKVTEEGLVKALKKAGGTCLGCDRTFSIEDHKDIHWIKEDAMVCEKCSQDPFILHCMGGYS